MCTVDIYLLIVTCVCVCVDVCEQSFMQYMWTCLFVCVCLPQNTLEKYKYTNTKLEYIHVPAVQIPARVGVAASALKSGSTVATVAHFGSFRPVIGF